MGTRRRETAARLDLEASQQGGACSDTLRACHRDEEAHCVLEHPLLKPRQIAIFFCWRSTQCCDRSPFLLISFCWRSTQCCDRSPFLQICVMTSSKASAHCWLYQTKPTAC